MRIGEIGSLNIDEHIDLKLKQIKIERTLTKDKKKVILLWEHLPKLVKRKENKNKPDFRIIPFGIFEEEIVISIIKEQIEIAKSNPNNKENLLFCKKMEVI